MQILNLIRTEESDIKYNIIQFPDGEPHIVLDNIDRKDEVDVLCRVTNPKDLFILMQVGDILNRHGVRFNLNISYLMSMRMDRVISFNEAFSLNVVANIINSMNPYTVKILEPHSNKIFLINHCTWDSGSKYGTDMFEDYIRVLPDAGAASRSTVTFVPTVYCSKVRDLSTGKLSSFNIENPKEITDNPNVPLVVIDDLCDGGGTFAGVAAEIRKIDPNRKLSIYVTHMVNPKGIITLSENYDEVFFTNSYKDWQKEELPKNVKVIEVV